METKTSPQKFKALVVEDEADIRELIGLHLRREGFEVDTAGDAESAVQKLAQTSVNLLVLDWMLPGMSGLEILRKVRAYAPTQKIPVLMVTARSEPTDIVAGLEAGADDYVVKPFDIPILMARVRALCRRAVDKAGSTGNLPSSASGVQQNILQIGQLKMNTESYEAFCGSTQLQLTPSEYKLLLTLVQNRGRVLTRDQLIDAVQGIGVAVVERAIDTHVFGLRKKMGPCADVIETVRGVGDRVSTQDQRA